MRQALCNLISAVSSGVSALALSFAILSAGAVANADPNPDPPVNPVAAGNCAGCLGAGNVGALCTPAGIGCPIAACTTCTCVAPAPNGGTCK